MTADSNTVGFRRWAIGSALIALIASTTVYLIHHDPASNGSSSAPKSTGPVTTVGTPTDPPRILEPGARPVPAERAAILLTPTDLGRGWYYARTAGVMFGTPTLLDRDAATSTVDTWLVAESWDGKEWNEYQQIIEDARRYPTRVLARQAAHNLGFGIACNPCREPASDLRRSRVEGLVIWHIGALATNEMIQAHFAVGRTVFTLRVPPAFNASDAGTSPAKVLRLAAHDALTRRTPAPILGG